MAFLVEDGSGVKGATSYATVNEFKAYFTDRAVTAALALTDPQIQAALIAATDYIDTRWGLKLKGTRQFDEYLTSRSAYTLSDQPSDGDTVTVGTAVATFKTTATLDTHAEIGDTLYGTLCNLATALNAAAAAADGEVADFYFPDPDVATMVIYISYDGIATTTTAANGSFDVATSTGASLKQQPLQFPRSLLRDSTGELVVGVPVKLKNATIEYAYRASSAVLAPDPTVDATGGKVIGTRKKVGPIETETTYSSDANITVTKPYPAADRLLQEYVKGNSGLVRA